jgi:hypothetical protein
MMPHGARFASHGPPPTIQGFRTSFPRHARAYTDLKTADDLLSEGISGTTPRLDDAKYATRVIPRFEGSLVLDKASDRALSDAPVLDHGAAAHLVVEFWVECRECGVKFRVQGFGFESKTDSGVYFVWL